MIITIVAFRDDQSRSVAYRKFDTDASLGFQKAIDFYKMMMMRDDVRVISTRKVKPKK